MLGAAVADDVLGLVILTVVVRVVSEGSVEPLDVVKILAVAIGFLVVAGLVGSRYAPGAFQWVERRARSAGTLVALALAFTLALAELADAAQLAPIVGAFVAGLALSRSTAAERIQRELAPVGHLFIPVFFLQIGIDTDIGDFVKPKVLGIAAGLIVVAVVGKMLAGLATMRAPGDKLLIGLGMLPRGEVGLIFATIGLREKILGQDLYAALLLVVLVTTIVTPPLLRWRLERIRAGAAGVREAPEPRPEGGWLVAHGGVVDLAARPPAQLALDVSLRAATAIAGGARPGSSLLDWIGTGSDVPLRWDDDATAGLFRVLTEGDVRAWRFLETTGVLERALPELAQAVHRRRADPFLLDPAQVLRFALVDRIKELVASDPSVAAEHTRLEHAEWLLLGALILDAVGDEPTRIEIARRVAHRLDLGAAAEEEIALLVGDADLLRAAARRLDGLEEEQVVPIAIHLGRAERARALYILSIALGQLERWDRERLDELFVLVVDLLDRPEVTGLDARNLVERRRAEATRLVTDPAVIDRIREAPRSYVLSQPAPDIAREATLVDPRPGRNEARVAVVALDDSSWRIEVASRDRPGLLATISGVLADQGLDIVDAVVATWSDGAAVDSFIVRRAELQPARLAPEELALVPAPESEVLRSAIEAAFDFPLAALPNPDAQLRFDGLSSPWYTICEVRSPDRRGLLHSLSAGISSAGADVHSARLVTVDGHAVDRFELTDRNGRKLDASAEDAVADAVRRGVAPRRGLFGRRAR